MSLFKRLFGADPASQLAKGERALTSQQPAAALDHFQRAEEAAAGDADILARAREGAQQATAGLVDLNLQEAEYCLDAEDPDTAMSHLETALGLAASDDQRKRVEHRMELMKDTLRAANQPQSLFSDEGAIPESDDLPEIQWERLLATLVEDWAEDYAERGIEFRDAVLALNNMQPDVAKTLLTELIEEDPEDPVLRFERGRAYLALEAFAEAADDLAFAREEIGFEPLDNAGLVQVGLLEADALISLKRPKEARELLDRAIEELGDDLSLLFLRGRVELALAEHDRVEETFGRILLISPRLVDAAVLLAQSRLTREDTDGAIEVLEQGIKKHCATGTCHMQQLSVPAGRLLARCYLDKGESLDRAEDLLHQVRASNEGHQEWEDHLLWGRLHKARGDVAALDAAREAALAGLPKEAAPLRPVILEQLE